MTDLAVYIEMWYILGYMIPITGIVTSKTSSINFMCYSSSQCCLYSWATFHVLLVVKQDFLCKCVYWRQGAKRKTRRCGEISIEYIQCSNRFSFRCESESRFDAPNLDESHTLPPRMQTEMLNGEVLHCIYHTCVSSILIIMTNFETEKIKNLLPLP